MTEPKHWLATEDPRTFGRFQHDFYDELVLASQAASLKILDQARARLLEARALTLPSLADRVCWSPVTTPCCDRPKTRGPNLAGEMVCEVHCSQCGHERGHEDYLGFCSLCTGNDPCSRTRQVISNEAWLKAAGFTEADNPTAEDMLKAMPTEVPDYDGWVEHTRHIRTWIRGGATSTEALAAELRLWLGWIDAGDIRLIHEKPQPTRTEHLRWKYAEEHAKRLIGQDHIVSIEMLLDVDHVDDEGTPDEEHYVYDEFVVLDHGPRPPRPPRP